MEFKGWLGGLIIILIIFVIILILLGFYLRNLSFVDLAKTAENLFK